MMALNPSSSRIYSAADAEAPVAAVRTSYSVLNVGTASSSVASMTPVTASITAMITSSLHMLKVDCAMWWAISPTQYGRNGQDIGIVDSVIDRFLDGALHLFPVPFHVLLGIERGHAGSIHQFRLGMDRPLVHFLHHPDLCRNRIRQGRTLLHFVGEHIPEP